MDQTSPEPQQPQTGAVSPRDHLLFGLMFTVIACIFLYAFTQSTTLVCTRINARRIDGLAHRTCFGIVPLSNWHIDDLLQAELREHEGDEGLTTYNIVLQTVSCPIELNTSSHDHCETTRIIRQINDFLSNPTSTILTVQTQTIGWGAVIPLALVTAGLLTTVQAALMLRKGEAPEQRK